MEHFYLDSYSSSDLYTAITASSASVTGFYDRVLGQLWNEKRKPVLMRPPFQWA